MKKLTFTLLASIALSMGINAQSLPCGNSGAAACSAGAALSYNGFEFYDSIPCFESGVQGEVTIRFKNFTSLTIPGTGPVTVYYLKIDSIKNLPCGLCWSTNKSNNVFAGGEQGCIKISGLTADQLGQYKLDLDLRAQITPGNYNEQALVTPPGGFQAYENDIPNARMYIRLKANGSTTCSNVDTTAGTKVAAKVCPSVGIADVASTFTSLSVKPNPFNTFATLTFDAAEATSSFVTINDLSGKTVWSKEVEISNGSNSIVIERANLTAGIYFVNLSNGKSSVTKRFSIVD